MIFGIRRTLYGIHKTFDQTRAESSRTSCIKTVIDIMHLIMISSSMHISYFHFRFNQLRNQLVHCFLSIFRRISIQLLLIPSQHLLGGKIVIIFIRPAPVIAFIPTLCQSRTGKISSSNCKNRHRIIPIQTILNIII